MGTFLSRFGLSSAVALILVSANVSAQTSSDCAARYKGFMMKMTRQPQKKLSGEQLAALNRRAQRIYDACQTGHLPDPRRLFDDLDRGSN
jgi:transposase